MLGGGVPWVLPTGWAPATSSSKKSNQQKKATRLSFPAKSPAPPASPGDLRGAEAAETGANPPPGWATGGHFYLQLALPMARTSSGWAQGGTAPWRWQRCSLSSWHRAPLRTRQAAAASWGSPVSRSKFSRAFSATLLACEEEEEEEVVAGALLCPSAPPLLALAPPTWLLDSPTKEVTRLPSLRAGGCSAPSPGGVPGCS